jgi:hypothetical protein
MVKNSGTKTRGAGGDLRTVSMRLPGEIHDQVKALAEAYDISTHDLLMLCFGIGFPVMQAAQEDVVDGEEIRLGGFEPEGLSSTFGGVKDSSLLYGKQSMLTACVIGPVLKWLGLSLFDNKWDFVDREEDEARYIMKRIENHVNILNNVRRGVNQDPIVYEEGDAPEIMERGVEDVTIKQAGDIASQLTEVVEKQKLAMAK